MPQCLLQLLEQSFQGSLAAFKAHLNFHWGAQHHCLLLDALSKLGVVVIDVQQSDEHLSQAVPALHIFCLHIEVVPGSSLSIQVGPGLGVDDPSGWVDQEAVGTESAGTVHMHVHMQKPAVKSCLQEVAVMHMHLLQSVPVLLSPSLQSDWGSRTNHLLAHLSTLNLTTESQPLQKHLCKLYLAILASTLCSFFLFEFNIIIILK